MSRLMKTVGFGTAGVAVACVAGGIVISVLDATERSDSERADIASARALAALMESAFDYRVEAIVAGQQIGGSDGDVVREMRGSILQNGQSKPFFAVGRMTCDETDGLSEAACWRLEAMFLDGEAVALGQEPPAGGVAPALAEAVIRETPSPALAAAEAPASERPPQPQTIEQAPLAVAPSPQPAPARRPAAERAEIAEIAETRAPISGEEAEELVEAAAQLLDSADSAGGPTVAALSGDVGRAILAAAATPPPLVSEIRGDATHEIGGTEVNLRAGPDTTFASLGLVRRGLRLHLIETVGAWGRFQVVDEASDVVARGQEVWVYLPLTAPI